MSIVITGATGHLGQLVVHALLDRGVAPDEIVAGGRDRERLAELAALGVRAVVADYDDPATLDAALDGARRVLLISGIEPNRVAQHAAVVEAARRAGAELIAYTSALYAATTSMLLAADHRATEIMIQESGMTHTFLRNGWYFENHTRQLAGYLERGAIVGSAGDGRISAAPRADYAQAAAAVLTTDGHQNAVYELGGDTSFTLTELAAEITRASGRTVTYQDVPQVQLEAILAGTGMPAPLPAIMADVDRAVRAGLLEITSGDLARLIGHPTGTLEDAVQAAVANEAGVQPV